MRGLLVGVLLVPMMAPVRQVRADSHGVTVVNAGTETIRRIEIGTSDNRLRSQLPPGAQARITYSTGCQADVRLGFESGRTEAFPGVDICADPRVETGKGVTGAALSAPSHVAASGSAARGGSAPSPAAVSAATPVKAPPPVVPPWTGRSITKRFGGLD